MKSKLSLQAVCAFPVTPSDTGTILNDAGNYGAFESVYLHNWGTAGIVYVTPAGQTDTTNSYDVPIYLAAGQTSNIAVKKVWATGLGAGVTLTAFVGKGGDF